MTQTTAATILIIGYIISLVSLILYERKIYKKGYSKGFYDGYNRAKEHTKQIDPNIYISKEMDDETKKKFYKAFYNIDL